MRRLLEAGVPSQPIETIFITHGHLDHALGLADVLADEYHYLAVIAPASRQEFDVYGPPETPALVSAAYEYIKIHYGIFAAEPIGKNEFVDPFRAHVIDHDGLVYQDDTIRLTAAENSHYQLLPAKYHASMKSSISGPVFAGEDLVRYCLVTDAKSRGNGARAGARRLKLCPK